MESLLISLIVLAVVIWLVWFILSRIPIPEPIRTVVYVVVGLICLLWVLQYLPGAGIHFGR